MVYFINDIITGALIGLLYSLVAMGFVVIYRASKVFNFAQGELVIIGGFIVWFTTMQAGLSLWLSIPLSLVLAGLVGYAIERIFLTKLIGESVFSMVMVTVGLLILLRGLVLLVFGPAVRPFPIIFPLKPLFLGDMLIPMNLLIGGIITIVAAVGLSWFTDGVAALAKGKGKAKAAAFARGTDYYLTNPICRASRVMGELAALAASGQGATGTDG